MTNKVILAILSASVIALGIWGYVTSIQLKKYQQEQINDLRVEAQSANDSAMYYLNNIQLEVDGMKLRYDSINGLFLSAQAKQQRQIRDINNKYEGIYQHIDTVGLDSLLLLLSRELEIQD